MRMRWNAPSATTQKSFTAEEEETEDEDKMMRDDRV